MTTQPEMEIKDGWVFASRGANRALRGAREIVVTSIYPTKMQASVQDLRTGHGWRVSLFSLTGGQWEHTYNAWETTIR